MPEYMTSSQNLRALPPNPDLHEMQSLICRNRTFQGMKFTSEQTLSHVKILGSRRTANRLTH